MATPIPATSPSGQPSGRQLAMAELTARGQLNASGDACTVCSGTPESHINPTTGKFQGCGAARKFNLDGVPWGVAFGEWTLEVSDFPRRAIRSDQERIAYSIVRALARSSKAITSTSLALANPTWSVRDAYRILRSLEHRGILSRVRLAGEEEPEEDNITLPPGLPPSVA